MSSFTLRGRSAVSGTGLLAATPSVNPPFPKIVLPSLFV